MSSQAHSKAARYAVGPCDCGAEDCPECFPPVEDEDDGPDEDEEQDDYDPDDDDNEYMDYICAGYRDSPY
jgi:hypothetical protein